MLSHSLGTYLCLYTARGNTHSGLNILLVPQFTMYHYLRLCLVRFGIAVLESVLTLCMVLLPLPPMIAAPLGVSTISLFFIILIQHLRGTDEGDAPGVRQVFKTLINTLYS